MIEIDDAAQLQALYIAVGTQLSYLLRVILTDRYYQQYIEQHGTVETVKEAAREVQRMRLRIEHLEMVAGKERTP